MSKPSSTQAAVVTTERKRELLIKARQARVSWVESSSSPYRNSLENDEDKIVLLGTSAASNCLESAIPVISVLYGKYESSDDETVKEIEKRIRSQADIIRDELQHEDLNGNKANPMMDHSQFIDKEFLSNYKHMIRKLCSPESSELVQGMRHYERALAQSVDVAEENETSIEAHNKLTEKVATSIKHSLKSLHSKFASHPFWKLDGELSEESKSCLDVFMYSKWKTTVYNILQTADLSGQENELNERLSFLQFVKPSHLDLTFFGSGEAENWVGILSKPIELLTTLDLLYSPAQMLQCTTEIYRSINEVLSKRMKDEHDGMVPSADDILPTLVLATICAKPKHIVSNLRFLECFATEEELRGESGYAFTSLFSAVQFIREIRLDEEKEGSESGKGSLPSLSISEKDLREELESFRASLTPKEIKKEDDSMDKDDSTDKDNTLLSKVTKVVDIPVGEVKAARLRGDDMNKWASDWVENNCTHAIDVTPSGEETGQIGNSTLVEVESQALPHGFNRSYKYLSTEAKDIRLSDIEPLLEEYKMLVYVTEQLLNERSAMKNNSAKEMLALRREELNKHLSQASEILTKQEGTYD